MCIYYRSVNLIHETKDRWIYALAFGALAGDFLEITLRGNYGDFLPSANTTGGNILKGTGLYVIDVITSFVIQEYCY